MKGEEVRRRRKAMGLTQAQLGEKVGVVQSAISALERGGPIGDDIMVKIKAALDGAPLRPTAKEDTEMHTPSHDLDLEQAVGAAFHPTRHLLRDANAVMAAFGAGPLPKASAEELLAICRQWLDAAAALREQGAAVTPQSIATQAALMAARSPARPQPGASVPSFDRDDEVTAAGSHQRRRF